MSADSDTIFEILRLLTRKASVINTASSKDMECVRISMPEGYDLLLYKVPKDAVLPGHFKTD